MKKFLAPFLVLSAILAWAGAVHIGAIQSPLGIFSKEDITQVYILRVLDSLGTRAGQLIGLNIEQELNPPSSANYFNFGQATELFTASANSQTFPSQNQAVYGSFNHFGSGALNSGFGASFESFNAGPATATLLVGVAGDATNGGVAAGVPSQTPTNNGNATNLRAVDAFVRNLSSGVVANAVSFYVEPPVNSGGGSITNLYGLLIQDQTIGTNNWAIKTGAGDVQFAGKLRQDGLAQFSSQVGIGVSPPAGIAVAIQPNGFAQLGNGTSQTGLYVFPSTTQTATAAGIGIQTRADVAVNTAQTINISLDVQTPSIGSGGSIGTWDGVRIEQPPTAGSVCSLFIAGTSTGSTCINAPATGGGVNTLPAISGNLAVVVGSGTAVMTTAGIGAGSCGSTVSVSAPNVTTSDSISWSFNAAPAGSNAGLVSWPTGGNVNFAYCPNSAETPAAATITWRVVR